MHIKNVFLSEVFILLCFLCTEKHAKIQQNPILPPAAFFFWCQDVEEVGCYYYRWKSQNNLEYYKIRMHLVIAVVSGFLHILLQFSN